MKKFLTYCCTLLFISLRTFAQDEAPKDLENCKDHPMFTRMPNTFINECRQNYNELEIPITLENKQTKEGTLTYVAYDFVAPGKPAPSFLQIVKNYENALAKYGGKRIFYNTSMGRGTLFLKNGGKDYWIVLEDFGGVKEGNYSINILEIEEMKQEVSATAIMDELNKSGKIALYINFETGKSVIKPESQKIIDDIAQMLTDNATVKISIEGHTDNVGTPASNKALSESRSKAVMNALVAKGIAGARMSSKGWGQDKPTDDNTTEAGKAKNRRVEIVKL